MSTRFFSAALLSGLLVLPPAANLGLAAAQSAAPTADARPVVMQSTQPDRVIVRSGMPDPVPAGPAPDFATLDQHRRGHLDEDDARAYPLLANDFINADGNRDGRISKREYERWVSRM